MFFEVGLGHVVFYSHPFQHLPTSLWTPWFTQLTPHSLSNRTFLWLPRSSCVIFSVFSVFLHWETFTIWATALKTGKSRPWKLIWQLMKFPQTCQYPSRLRDRAWLVPLVMTQHYEENITNKRQDESLIFCIKGARLNMIWHLRHLRRILLSTFIKKCSGKVLR